MSVVRQFMRMKGWRAFISAQVRQHDLRVIDMDTRTSRRADTTDIRHHPR